MAIAGPMLKDRFAGCLLGLAIGDALGGKFEAQSADAIRARFSSVEQLIAYPQEEIWYTDDTKMAIGVAETLIAKGEEFNPRIEHGSGQPRGQRSASGSKLRILVDY